MVSRRTLIAVFAALTIATMVAAQGPPTDPTSNAPKPMTLTAIDYIEIEQLVAKYSRALEYDGYYDDVYVKTPQGWRFKSRTHHAVLSEGRRVK
jgi:hypothetical protein